MTRPRPARARGTRLAAAALAVVAVVLLVVGIVKLTDNGDDSSPASASGPAPHTSIGRAIAAATPARAPFSQLTHTRVRVGAKVLDVVVADSEAERETGLRKRSDLGPYDGMLFVFPADTSTSFTMSTVPVPLAIGFFSASGAPVDRLLMQPCTGTDRTCPLYQSKRPFRYALETLAGQLPVGALSGATG